MYIFSLKEGKGKKVEVYVNSELKYVQSLQQERKTLFIETDIGGVTLEFQEMKVRAVTSNSPRKIVVKQGWIKNPGDVLIGIPDKIVVKIKGDGEEELDSIAK